MGHRLGKGKFSYDLFPVSPGESGDGLPYAPVDCPNPGDIWRWAATGKAIKKNGYFKDRILFAPERLQKRPSRKRDFMSKKSVERFLRSELPEVDINAFFQSFTWDIPAKTDPKTNGTVTTRIPQSAASQGGNKRCKSDGVVFKSTQKYSRRQKRQRPSDFRETVDITKEGEETLANAGVTNCKEDDSVGQVSNNLATDSAGINICSSVPGCKLATPNDSLEEFDNYINWLDEILSKKGCSSLVEARQRLSSLLAMGFPNLVSSSKINELLSLASELMKNDSTLSHEELSVLKLIQEIPSIIPHYLEVKESSEQVDKYFVELESKIMAVSCLKNEYTNAKQEKEVLQVEESSLLLSAMETNDEIEKLQSLKVSVKENIKKTNKRIVQCDCIQQKVMDCLPQMVQEIQEANSKKEKWQLKKKELSEQEAEILAKFAPFMGFSFYKMS